MAIDIIIQNQVHGKVEVISGAPAVTLSDIVLQAPVGSMLRGIHQYADSMFNSYQLQFFLEELAGLQPKDSREEELFSVLRRAADVAIRNHGYLWFSGD
ncbi:hypothetical protein ABIA39_004310 [Nocardia sp. GAS34]|uniref:hypothetical protein n=1 Tax=unclassified Nocardia TaxID=2637762 RepID=UPI003D20BE1A